MSISTLTRLAPTQVALEIPITGDELAAAEERAFRRLVKNARLPGFRRGKVPRKVFEQAYGADAITSQAMEEVLPDAYAKAVREHDLEPVERPKMEILERDGGRPTRLKATVEVRPEIALGAYKGVAVSLPATIVTEEDVERSLQALAKERATLVPVDRPIRLGDVATLDYEGTVDGVAFDGGSAKGQVTELIEGRFIPGFAAGIAGMRAGETKALNAQFPEGYPEAGLAGKPAVFTVTLHDVKELELPAIDDELAKAVSENQTLGDLRADIRRRLDTIARARERRAIGNAVVEKLSEAHDFPLPPTMVEAEIDHMLNDAVPAAGDGKGEEELRERLRADAQARVKAMLLIEQIAKRESIAATPADVQEELEALGRQYGQPVARIRKALGSNVLSLMEGIVRNKTLDFLIDQAEVTTGEETPGSAS